MREQLDRYFAGELETEEKEAMLKEIAVDEEFKEEFLSLQNIAGICHFSTREGDEALGRASLFQFEQARKRERKRHFIYQSCKYAAVMAVLLISTWFVTKQYYLSSDLQSIAYTQIEVPIGQRVHITMADGTEVWLNSRSKLTYPNSFAANRREVTLDGEGFFSVKRDEQKPFIVKTSKYHVEVLGTQFNVFSYATSPVFETTLVSGSVKVFKELEKNQAVILSPNEEVVEKDGVLQTRLANTSQVLSWQNGDLFFDNAYLEDILRKLESYYDVKFVVQNEAVLKDHYRGNFSLQDPVEVLLDALQKVQKFSFTTSPDRKVIYIQ